MTSTHERAQSIDFSVPYLKIGLSLLVNATSSVDSVEDLNQSHLTVTVKQGTTVHLYAIEHLQNAKQLFDTMDIPFDFSQ